MTLHCTAFKCCTMLQFHPTPRPSMQELIVRAAQYNINIVLTTYSCGLACDTDRDNERSEQKSSFPI